MTNSNVQFWYDNRGTGIFLMYNKSSHNRLLSEHRLHRRQKINSNTVTKIHLDSLSILLPRTIIFFEGKKTTFVLFCLYFLVTTCTST